MVTTAADVVEELRGVGYHRPSARGLPADSGTDAAAMGKREAKLATATPSLDLSTSSEARMLAALSSFPAHIDDLVTAAGLSAPEALATLLQLELRGLACSLPGKRFTRP